MENNGIVNQETMGLNLQPNPQSSQLPSPQPEKTPTIVNTPPQVQNTNPIAPPKSLFTDDTPPNTSKLNYPWLEQEKFLISENMDFDTMLVYLLRNLEQEGYKDALHVPDFHYMDLNIEKHVSDLLIWFERSLAFYEEEVKKIDTHIERNRNAGFISIVFNLEKNKEKTSSHIQKLVGLIKDFEQKKGLCSKIIQSYTIGFKRGIAALAKDEFNLY